MAPDYKGDIRATCIAFGADLHNLYEFGRRVTQAGHRPILANTFELVAELFERTNLQVIVADLPDRDPVPAVNAISSRVLELVPSARLVFQAPAGFESWTGVINPEVVYFVVREAPVSRLKAVIDMATFADGLTGSVSHIDLIDFLKLLLMKRASSTVAVRGSKASGLIVIESGEIIDARCGTLTGNDALFDMLAQKRGQFSEVEPPTRLEHTIVGDGDALLLEAARLRDARAGGALVKADGAVAGVAISDALATKEESKDGD